MPNRPALADITPTTPLRLDLAAQLAFPDGTMTVSGLRKERDRGRLRVSKIAGKEYTTLAAIQEMIEGCVVAPQKVPAFGSSPSERDRTDPSSAPSGASSTTADTSAALDAAKRTVEALKSISPVTSQGNGSRTARATVVPLRS